ncbi:MAG TPA: ferredoxin, partial [Streptosporangiaceae bacterium]|nr:ferredoxin [Streptosporangiaceae bacterium]
MTAVADKDVCVGAGMCVLTAPELFDQDDDGLVAVLRSDPSPRLGGAPLGYDRVLRVGGRGPAGLEDGHAGQ